MRTRVVSLVASLALLTVVAACKGEEGKREAFAEEIALKMPKCNVSAGSHDSSELTVFCEDVDTEYVVTKVFPAVKESCSKLKQLKFEHIQIYGQSGSNKSWSRIVDEEATCEF